MGVATHDRNRMLPAERGDPHVIGRNRLTSALQLQPDSRVVPRGLNPNIEHRASVQHTLQRPFVGLAVARLRDTESKLPGYDDRDRQLASPRYDLNRIRRAVKISGKSVRIENQAQSSGSIWSNSSSMIF